MTFRPTTQAIIRIQMDQMVGGPIVRIIAERISHQVQNSILNSDSMATQMRAVDASWIRATPWVT